MRKTPKEARTNDDLCALPRDSVSSGDYWCIVDEDSITVAEQKPGERCLSMTTLPRSVFEKFARWYETGSMNARRSR